MMSSIGPSPGTRALSHIQTDVDPPPVGKRTSIQRRKESPNGHCYRKGRPLRCRATGISQQSGTGQHYVCRPTSSGPHACRHRGLADMGWLLLNLGRTTAATTLDREKFPPTSAATNSPPSRWKNLGASEMKASTKSTRWRQTLSEGRTDSPYRGTGSARNVCKQRVVLIISVPTLVAISPRVHRYKLALRNRKAALRRI